MTSKICPRCKENGTEKVKQVFAKWQIYVAILLFPVGLLFLLQGKQSLKCNRCGKRWKA